MPNKPKADQGLICPLMKVDRSEVCHNCEWWQLVRGSHPQTGAEIDQWSCAVALLPMLIIENAKEARQTAAAVESFRNEMVKANELSLALMAEGQKRLLS